MQTNKNAQDLIDECSDNQLSQRASGLSNSSSQNILLERLPQCAFKLSYSQKQENYAEKLVDEVLNGAKNR